MKISDPRLWGIKKPWGALLVFLGLTFLFAWDNAYVEKGGILDEDVILREDDSWRQMDRYVREKTEEGFEGREFIPFILNGGIHSTEDLKKILDKHAVEGRARKRIIQSHSEWYGEAEFVVREKRKKITSRCRRLLQKIF